MTELTQVMLVGKFRGKEAQASYTRIPKGWRLTVTVGGKSKKVSLGKWSKPCWTIAIKYMESLCPPKPRKVRERPEAKADDGMILKFAQ